MKSELVNESKVFDEMKKVKGFIEGLSLTKSEKVVLLKNLVAHEENVIERENLAAAMFNALNNRN